MTSRPHRLNALIGAGVLLALLALVAVVELAFPATASNFESAMQVVALIGVVALISYVEPAITLSAGVALASFSGKWQYMGLPVGVDRLVLLGGVLAVAYRVLSRRTETVPFRLGAAHWLVLIAGTYALISAVVVGGLGNQKDFLAMTDRFGLIPFALFFAAPIAFSGPRERSILLGALVALGAYLGFVTAAQGVGADPLVYPKFILDPTLGIHADRARGPFLEAAANGLGLYVCVVAGLLAFRTWRDPRWRAVALGVSALCLLGIVFTLTRQAWLGATVASVVTLIAAPPLRKFFIPAMVAGFLAVVALFAVVPGLENKAHDRAGDNKPVWDRYNSGRAAINMIAAKPILGFGWGRFGEDSLDYYELGDTYPLSKVEDLHNVFLANAVELGGVGLVLWMLALGTATLGPILRRGPPELEEWRWGLLAIVVCWVVVANFTPFSYAFSNDVIWLLAGVFGASAAAPVREFVQPPRRAYAHA